MSPKTKIQREAESSDAESGGESSRQLADVVANLMSDVLPALIQQLADMQAITATLLTGQQGDRSSFALQSTGGSSERGLKPDKPEKFSGDSSKLRMFISQAKFYLAAWPRASEAERVHALGGLLTGPAFKKFDLTFTPPYEGVTVSTVVSMLESHFADPHEAHGARYRFHHLKQGAMSVLDFSNALDDLLSTPGMEDQRADMNVLHRFLTGMHPELFTLLIPTEHTFCSKADALVPAITFERAMARQQQGQQHQHGKPTAGLANVQSSPTGGERPQHKERPSGSTRGNAATNQRQHHQSGNQACGQLEPVPGRDGKLYPHLQCHSCGHYGHYKRACPARLPGRV